jgi:hypothetical protein
MVDFSGSEKVNASWKHLFGLLPTSNADGSAGRFWYEEPYAATHTILPSDIWADPVPTANSLSQAQALASGVVEDRSQDESITLVANGSDWDITTSSIVPKAGFQITDVHPNPGYIKSITNVVDNGGGSYTITLNDNTGVSAGSAVLQGRIYLTRDPSSNGLAWMAREEYGNSFGDRVENFLQPQLFGTGYTLRIFQADGTEITTTEGAWIPQYQKGMVLFANGFTPTDLGYAMPLYIEAFRYTGSFGGGSSLLSGNLHDTLRWDGVKWAPTGALQSTGVDVNVLNRLTVSGSVVVPSGTMPASSASPGDKGELRWDGRYLYHHAGDKWRRVEMSIF